MKRPGLWLGLILIASLLVWLLVGRWKTAGPDPTPAPVETGMATTSSPAPGIIAITTPGSPEPAPGEPTPLIGELMLRDYGDPTMSPVKDIQMMAGLLNNVTLLVKTLQDRPMSGNEDWAAALRGANPAQQRFLPDQHRVFNEEGLLVDRWGTPLFFHPIARKEYEIRSAGPDKKMWTADDLHRNPDGTFREEADLNAPGLYNPPPAPGPR